MDIGFIGLGSMGLPMAANLLAAGHHLRVHNRTASKADPLLKRGAELMSNAAAVAAPGGIVITMLADDAAVAEAVVGVDTIAQRHPHLDEHYRAGDLAQAGAISRGARQHLCYGSGIRPARSRGSKTSLDLYLGASRREA
jgi:hypothetical protein